MPRTKLPHILRYITERRPAAQPADRQRLPRRRRQHPPDPALRRARRRPGEARASWRATRSSTSASPSAAASPASTASASRRWNSCPSCSRPKTSPPWSPCGTRSTPRAAATPSRCSPAAAAASSGKARGIGAGVEGSIMVARKSYETVILEVALRSNRAIHENRRQEWIIIALLSAALRHRARADHLWGVPGLMARSCPGGLAEPNDCFSDPPSYRIEGR